MKNFLTVFMVFSVLVSAPALAKQRTASNKNLKQDSVVASSTDDILLFLGPDTDLTGPKNTSDGRLDLHLQLLHVFQKGEKLEKINVDWFGNPEVNQGAHTGWTDNVDQFRLVVLADGKNISEGPQGLKQSGELLGRVRLDIYLPYMNDPKHVSSGSSYTVKMTIRDSTGKFSDVESSVKLK